MDAYGAESTANDTRGPLPARAREALASAVHQRSLAGLSGQLRRDTANRIAELRAAKNPAALLISWWSDADDPLAEEDQPVNGGTNLLEHARAGRGEYVFETLHRRVPEYLRRPADLAEIVDSERMIRQLSIEALAERAGVLAADVEAVQQTGVASLPVMRRVLDALDIEPSALPSPPDLMARA